MKAVRLGGGELSGWVRAGMVAWWMTHSRSGLWYGLLGVVIFSFTLPATRMAVKGGLSPVLVGLGRAVVAAVFAGVTLVATGAKFPKRVHWPGLVGVALGCIVGFPWLTAQALKTVPASHGAILTGLLPLATALVARLRTHERPKARFWVCAVAGSTTVVSYALYVGDGQLHQGDWLLLVAMGAAAVGYAEGGIIARSLGGWETMCWALVIAAPALVWPAWKSLPAEPSIVPAQAWAGFAYTCVFSMFLGMISWYRGLALGGIARVGQVQLVQPFLTLFWAGLVLGEQWSWLAVVCALVVVTFVGIGRR